MRAQSIGVKPKDFFNCRPFSPSRIEPKCQTGRENWQRQIFQLVRATAKSRGQDFCRQHPAYETEEAKLSDRVKLLLLLKIFQRAIACCNIFHRAFAAPIIQTIRKNIDKILVNRLDGLPAIEQLIAFAFLSLFYIYWPSANLPG